MTELGAVELLIVVIIMSYLLIALSFPDLIGESRGKNLKHGFPIKTFGNDIECGLTYEFLSKFKKKI